MNGDRAGILATVLVAAACGAAPGASPSASGTVSPTLATGTESGAGTPGPPAMAWELVVDDPALGTAALVQAVAGGPGVVMLGVAGSSRRGDQRAVVFSSSDGRAWRAAPVELGWGGSGSLASGAGGLVAAGTAHDPQTGTSRFVSWHSDDGERWDRGSTPPDGAVRVTGLIDLGAGFLAVGCEVRETCLGLVVLTSDDGRTFVRLATVPGSESGVPLGVASGEPGYLAWATDCTDACAGEHVLIWLSEDGAGWTPAPGAPSPEADDVRFAGVTDWEHGYVAVGAVGTVDRRTGAGTSEPTSWVSPDGQTWQRTAGGRSFEYGTLLAVINVGDHLIAAGSVPDGDSTRAALWISGDGATWDRVPDAEVFDRGMIVALAVGPAGLVAIGREGAGHVTRPAVWIGPLP